MLFYYQMFIDLLLISQFYHVQNHVLNNFNLLNLIESLWYDRMQHMVCLDHVFHLYLNICSIYT